MITDLQPLHDALHEARENFRALLYTGDFSARTYDRLALAVRHAHEALDEAAKANAIAAFRDAGEYVPDWETAE